MAFEDYVIPLSVKFIPQFHFQSQVKHSHKSSPMISPFPRTQLVLASLEVAQAILPTHTLLCKSAALQCKLNSNNWPSEEWDKVTEVRKEEAPERQTGIAITEVTLWDSQEILR